MITPDDGYYIKSMTANGKKVTPSTSYEFDRASSSNKLVVEFAKVETPAPPSFIPSSPGSTFTDVSGHWAEEAITAFEQLGYVNGISSSIFAPDMAMTRGMFVTVLGRMCGASPLGGCSFSDVDDNMYYAGYIEWAYQNDIVDGIGDNKFAPDQMITRQEMAQMVNNYLVFRGFGTGHDDVHPFADDALISSWAKDAVYNLVGIGAIEGKPDNRFDPLSGATRAELVTVLYRVDHMY